MLVFLVPLWLLSMASAGVIFGQAVLDWGEGDSMWIVGLVIAGLNGSAAILLAFLILGRLGWL